MINNENIDELSLLNEEDVVSMTECTGLMSALPQSQSEEDSYNEIYRIQDADNEEEHERLNQ